MDTPVTSALASYVAEAPGRVLPADVLDRTKHHLLDGLVAMLSGSTLKPGVLATSYARSRGGVGESTLTGGTRTNPELAALANGMCAHADETDDVNDLVRLHPGASIVPAAIAVAEAYDRPGAALLAAVAVGYDVACSVNVGAYGSYPAIQRAIRAPHGLGQTFGAAAAAASLAELSVEQNQYVLSYAAHQVSGITTFYRDQQHIGKAFATAGVQATAGVRAAEMVRWGFTDVLDVFDTSPHAFDAFGEDADTSRLLRELGSRHHVLTTDIKQYPVGGPIQAPAEALETIILEQGLEVEDVASVEARLPQHGSRIVDNRSMPDINLQYMLSVLLMDGRVTFSNSHDYARLDLPETRELMRRIQLVPDPTLDVPDGVDSAQRITRRAIVTVTTRNGQTFSKRVDACLGSRFNPMTWDDLASKAHMVLDNVMAPGQVTDLVSCVRELDTMTSARELRSYLEAPNAAEVAAS